jgi:hypothetical protein
MSETDPRDQGYSEQHAGDVGSRRATVGTQTDRESVNVPPTRPGAAENALKAEAARQEHETFIPESPVPDDRTEAVEARRGEESSVQAASDETARTESADGVGETGEEEDDDVRKSIKDTRNELGDTVAALADKADVKGRASDAADAAKDKAAEVADIAKAKASQAAEVAADKVPDQVKDAADKVSTEAKKRPVLFIAAAGAAAIFILRRLTRRNRNK